MGANCCCDFCTEEGKHSCYKTELEHEKKDLENKVDDLEKIIQDLMEEKK